MADDSSLVDSGPVEGGAREESQAPAQDGGSDDAGNPMQGPAWTPEPSYAPNPAIGLTSVWGSGPGDVWVVGYYGLGDCCETVFARNGVEGNFGTGVTSDVWGTSATDVWFVGGGIGHWDGAQLTAASLPNMTASLASAWGASASDAWAVGDAGTIVRWDGARWSTAPSGTMSNLRSVRGSGASDVWAVGDAGTVLHWSGHAWSSMAPSGRAIDLLGVWALDAWNAWAVGVDTILRWDGAAWSPSTGSTGWGRLAAVWGSSPSDVWAVGDSIVHWDGTTWSVSVPSTAVPSPGLASIWGTSSTDIWAVGGSRTVLHYH